MAALLPLAAMAIPAIMSLISGGVSIAGAVKQLKGGRLRRHLMRLTGKGLSPMYIPRPYVGCGLRRKHVRRGKRGGLLYPAGHGLSPMYIPRPYVGMGVRRHQKAARKPHGGLLYPAGGRVRRRRVVHRGRGLYPPGGHSRAIMGNLVTLSKMLNHTYAANMVEPNHAFPVPRSMSSYPQPTKYAPPMTSLLSAHGAGVRRKGHYRHVNGKRVYVRPAGGRVHHRRMIHVRHRGKGAIADFLGRIPLLGMIAGPIASALGGRIRHHRRILHKGGRHGNLHRMGDTIRRILSGGAVKAHVRRGHYKRVGAKKVHVRATVARRGGALVHRRAHYKHIAGKRVHVRAAMVHKGGYMPLTFHTRPYGLR